MKKIKKVFKFFWFLVKLFGFGFLVLILILNDFIDSFDEDDAYEIF